MSFTAVKINKAIISLLMFSFIQVSASMQVMPELQMLSKPKSDSLVTKSDSTKKTTLDSAKIISPSIGAVITGKLVPVEIVPRCPVDSVTIYVRHSGIKTDTLGTKRKPPFKVLWNCENLTDHDQIHLQFGYILYHKAGIKIISGPMAHRWVLDRDKNISRKKYRCYQNTAPDTASINGVIDDWKNSKMVKIGNVCKFKVTWSGSHIFLAAHVLDSSVTYKDYVEFHFDLHNDKAEFADINHRSIRFGPKSRSNCFTIDLNDSGFTLADSVNVLLSREMRWGRKILPDGYSIEVSLPLFVLSDLQYPAKTIGFDVSVIDVDEGSEEEKFTSWAGSSITNRYNPSQWGNLVLLQAMFPLRLVMFTGTVLFLLVISVLVWVQIAQFYKSRSIEMIEDKVKSPFMIDILLAIQKRISDKTLSLSLLAGELGCASEKIEKTIQDEEGCTFEQLVKFNKVKLARNLLSETDINLEKIAEMTGFESSEEFKKYFIEATCVDPEVYRKRNRNDESM